MKQAFVNAKIYPIEGDIIEKGILLVENGKIKDLGQNISTDGYEIIDCDGLYITPCFIDAHSHVGLWEEGTGPDSANSDGNETTDTITPLRLVVQTCTSTVG